jgi:tRNA(adenine34) deaminase
MCSGAILWSGLPRVFYGTTIATLKRLGLDQIDLPCEEVSRRCSFGAFEATGGLLEAECDALFERWRAGWVRDSAYGS